YRIPTRVWTGGAAASHLAARIQNPVTLLAAAYHYHLAVVRVGVRRQKRVLPREAAAARSIPPRNRTNPIVRYAALRQRRRHQLGPTDAGKQAEDAACQ